VKHTGHDLDFAYVAKISTPSIQSIESRHISDHLFSKQITICALVCIFVAAAVLGCSAQSSLPFATSNPKHLKWSSDEAGRIYFTACEHVARAIRPEKPPRLHPGFILVLGTQHNETVRNGALSEVHLKTWDPASFAEAVVIMASREILDQEEMTSLTRDTLLSAQASVSVTDLRHGR
jgi:hypothetical protein